MDNHQPYSSRLNRYEKKRKNTKWLTFFIVIGTILILAFISIIFLTGSDEDVAQDPDVEISDSADENDQNEDNQANDEQDNQVDQGDNDADSPDESVDQEAESDQGEEVAEQDPNDFDLEIVDSDDENVEYAYTSSWSPIPTEQEEPHEITWEQSSVDWNEMMKAAELATGIGIDDMYYLWVSGNGPQSVTATFSNSAMEEHFRVYITWIEGQGWQPERGDVLENQDEMGRFGSNDETESDESGEQEDMENNDEEVQQGEE